MITYKMIIDAQETLVKFWGEDGQKVVEVCAKVTPFNNTANSSTIVQLVGVTGAECC